MSKGKWILNSVEAMIEYANEMGIEVQDADPIYLWMKTIKECDNLIAEGDLNPTSRDRIMSLRARAIENHQKFVRQEMPKQLDVKDDRVVKTIDEAKEEFIKNVTDQELADKELADDKANILDDLNNIKD